MPGITMDFYPTLLELARLPENQDQCLDGISLAKVLADPSSAEAKSADRFLAWTYPHNHGSNHRPSQAARQGNWKLIRHIDETTADEDRLELYDLAADPGESTNVIRDHQKVANSMVKRLDQWLETTMPALAK